MYYFLFNQVRKLFFVKSHCSSSKLKGLTLIIKDYDFNERLMRDNYCPSKKDAAAEIGISHLINCKRAAFVVLLRSFQYKSETMFASFT